ncbi:MAG: Do family serine endopeptidase [Bacteroides sp.]|nr:Do family serine endopeptidase [Bacteroides sp.]
MKRFWSLFLVAILASFLTLGLDRYVFNKETRRVKGLIESGELNAPPASLARYITQLPTTLPDFTLVAEMTVNSVVHIRTTYERKSSVYDDYFGMPDPFREFFFGPRRQQPSQAIVASGSGVIISQDGYIITNNHVVAEANTVEVTLNDNQVFEATIVGTDPTTDLAVIKIEKDGLPFLSFGDSDEVRVGEWVLAVGNPFNLTSTVTAGIVSAKGRNINILGGGTAIEAFIQTDAAVNRGNSGGALVNTQGELIGINAAIASQTGSYAGYSFAIPSNIAQKVLEDLLEFGQVQRGMLGVNITEINSRQAEELGLSAFRGAYVAGVVEGSAGEAAGLKEGDLIVGIDNTTIHSPSELIETVGRRRPGDEVMVKYIRDGREYEVKARLQNIYGEFTMVTSDQTALSEKFGATFEKVSAEELKRLNIRQGVRVTNIARNGIFRDAGIRDGFIVTQVDRQPVGTPEEFSRVLAGKSGGILVEGVYPDGQRAYYGMGIK